MRIRPVGFLATLLLWGCAAGPDFKGPQPLSTGQFTGGVQAQQTAAAGDAGTAQHFLSGQPMQERWWEAFGCPALNGLVDEALAHSPTVAEARARLREAQEDATAQSRGSQYPAFDAQFGISRQKVDPAAFGLATVPPEPPFTLYNAQVNVTYTLDVFGAQRRMIEGSRAQSEYQSYETQAAQLTLAANVVAAAIRQADLEAQIDYTRQLLDAQGRQFAISQDRYAQGGISEEDLQNLGSQLEQLRATLPGLQAQRQQIDHQLAVYTGRSPAEATIPRFRLEELQLPTEVPVTLPGELVRRRPDVRASEALWHEAGANAGVAAANLFPNLTISGYAGSDRTSASDLADSFNIWSIGARLLQPIFHAGELRAKKRSAADAYEAAAQSYEQTVLVSLQQVADSLRVLEADALVLKARAAAARHSADSYAIAQQRFAVGGISELSLLDAQRQQLQGSLDRAHAQSQRLADTAALLHALAGHA